MTLSDSQGHGDIVEVTRSKWIRKEKSFGPGFLVYLIEETRDSIENMFIVLIRILATLRRLGFTRCSILERSRPR